METSRRSERLPEPSPVGSRIYTIRGQSVMLDSDLAEVYGVETRRINEAVKRNPKRFTPLYSFQLDKNEWDILMSQIATSKTVGDARGGRRKLPHVFTEHGAVMLATVLNSGRAIQASMAVVEAFVRLRHAVDSNLVFARRLDELSAKVDRHDRAFAAVFEELKRLAGNPDPEPPKDRIGFKPNKERGISGKKKRGTS